MNSLHILLTLCIGLAASRVVKRQNTPSPPTLPPTKPQSTSGAPMVSDPATPAPPSAQPVDTTVFIEASTTQAPMTTDPSVMVDSTTPMVVQDNTTQPPMVPEITTTQASKPTKPPTPATTKKPTIDELVIVDEILEVFGNVATSDYFKKLSYEDQLLVMEILAGGETGKMSAVLNNVELKHLLTFMYNIPFKYADPLWRVIFLGYTREEIIAQ